MSNHPIVTVASMRWEYAEGRRLIGEYLTWALAQVHVSDIADVQAGAVAELADVRSYYAPPGGSLLLGWLEGTAPVAVCGVKRLDRSAAELKRMYVRRSARGRGLGALLVDEAISAAREMGCAFLRLETHPTITRSAVALYRAAGFVETERYGEIAIDELVAFELDLTKC